MYAIRSYYVLSDLCEINCKDAEILKDGKIITFEDLNSGYLINVEIGRNNFV